jgi:hypothetical protein
MLALVVQFIFFSGLLQSIGASPGKATAIGLYAIIAFLAGFSERFASDLLERTGTTLGTTDFPRLSNDRSMPLSDR